MNEILMRLSKTSIKIIAYVDASEVIFKTCPLHKKI